MKPTLFLLAAGMGSRYGGLKQLDGLGPNGETIMDYSIYDAIQAGFGKIVWVIRKDFEEQFSTQILSKYQGQVPCELCFQALDALEAQFAGNDTFVFGENLCAELLFEVLANHPYNLAESSLDSIVDGVVHDGFAVGTQSVELFQSAVAATHAGSK